jgi:glycosyltransferase involved in cell wall biosynthesis
MKILMISYYYPPHNAVGATRAYLVSKHLALRGHEVRVLAATPLPGMIDESKFPDWQAPADGRVRVRRVGRAEKWMALAKSRLLQAGGARASNEDQEDFQKRVTEASQQQRATVGPLKRLAQGGLNLLRGGAVPEREVSWNPEAFVAGLDEIRKDRPDGIYVCARPFVSFYVGAALKAATGVPLVLDLRDPWSMLSHNDPVAKAVIRAQERPIFAAADRIMFNTRTAMRRYQEVYPDEIRAKFFCAPNAMSRYPSSSPYAGPALDPEPLVLLHGGNLYRRSLNPLLLAVQRLSAEKHLSPAQLKVMQVGRIELDTFDPALVQALGPQVELHPFLPYAQFQALAAQATVQMVLLGPTNYMRIPAKFYEALASGRAILFLGPKDHEVVEVLSRTQLGASADAGDPDDIHRALVKLQTRILPHLRAQGGVPRDALAPFHIETRAQEIEALLQQAIRA